MSIDLSSSINGRTSLLTVDWSWNLRIQLSHLWKQKQTNYRATEMNNDLEAARHIAVQSISRWRRVAAVLFAHRRFLRTLYLKKEEEKEQASSKVQADAVVRAEHPLEIEEDTVTSTTTGDFGIGREERVALTENDDVGGREHHRRASPTHNIIFYPMTFLWEPCQDSLVLVIFIAAVTSAMMGLVTKGTRFGYWEGGGSVAVVVTVNIIVKAICKYIQSRLYNVKEERRNMYSKEVLNVVATSIGYFGLTVAFIAMIVLLLRWFTGHNLRGSPKFTGVKTKPRGVIEEVNQIIIIAFTIAVAAVPQGLPLAVTLTIVGAKKRMAAENARVRRAFACGTMAFAENFLCDKTVLTLNEMSVVQAYTGGKKIDFSDNTTPPLSPNLSSLLTEGIAYVSKSGGVDVSGSATEKAIQCWGIKLGMNFEDIKSQSSVRNVVPFNSERKRGAVALELPDSQVRVHWKGVPEILLRSCTNFIDANDHSVAMNDKKRMFFAKAIDDMAAGGLHCLAFAYRSCEFENELLAQGELPEDDLVLLAIVGIRDLCQPRVKENVQLCQRDGVKVRMVTGDNLPAAKAIALECGILGSDADLFDGRLFRELTDGERQECAQRIKVLAWCSPDVKLSSVQALKKRGEKVAVTGYVTDDARALLQADIGLAMGIRGTEVAKESSDIIILDDSFATCVKAFKWGQSVHANIIKFMELQLTVNAVALTTNFLAAVFYGHVPLNAVQLLWVNLVIVALVPPSLVTEPPPDEVMQGLLVEPGQPPKRYINWWRMGFQSLCQIGAILLVNFLGKKLLKSYTSGHATKVKDTMIFNAFVVCQITHQMGARKAGIQSKPKKWIASNYLFLGIVGTILTCQFIIIEFLGKVFSTVALNQNEWQCSLTNSFTEMFFGIILLIKYLTDMNH